MDTLKKFVVTYYNDYNFDMTDDWEYDWDFPKAWLFTITIMTTVGYGHISPKTFGGKMFCILYALIGKSKHGHYFHPCLLRLLSSDENKEAKSNVVLIFAITDHGCLMKA